MGQPPQIQNLKGNLTLLYFNSGTKIGKDPNNYKARMNFISKVCLWYQPSCHKI